ncbi:MAG: hypothetical protein LUQ59_03280 [Methanothrix sp.]|nr:hypothetical protein [Methanothrix sp.]
MILKRTEANARRVLADMEELGLVERTEYFYSRSKGKAWLEEDSQRRRLSMSKGKTGTGARDVIGRNDWTGAIISSGQKC